MANLQNSPRGVFGKAQVNVGAVQLTGDSTGNLKLNAGIKLSGEATLITVNSTAIVGSVAQLTLNSMNMRLAANDTGVGIQINTTGTTWLWVSTTSVGPA